MPSSHLASFIDEFATTGSVEIDPGKVLAALSGLKDSRKKRGVRHRFAHLLVIMVCSVVAGASTLVEMAEWATDTARDQLAALGIGAPHATTLARVFQRLDADALDRLAGAWAQGMTDVAAIAIDGKEVRGAKNARRHPGPPPRRHRPRHRGGARAGKRVQETQRDHLSSCPCWTASRT